MVAGDGQRVALVAVVDAARVDGIKVLRQTLFKTIGVLDDVRQRMELASDAHNVAARENEARRNATIADKRLTLADAALDISRSCFKTISALLSMRHPLTLRR